MKSKKQKIRKPKTCSWCGRYFPWTRPFEVHVRQTGEKSCIRAQQSN